MEITDETIRYAAALAKLELNKKEQEKAKEDISKILEYMDTMNTLDTEGIEPMSHVFPLKNVFREDVVTNGENREALLANAPRSRQGQFVVPRTIGENGAE